MKIEKLNIEKAKEGEKLKEFSIPSKSQSEFDMERLKSMIYYLVNFSNDYRTSINSYRKYLKVLKSQEGSRWKEKLYYAIESLGIHDTKTYEMLLNGQGAIVDPSNLNPPSDLFQAISYYYSHFDHIKKTPETLKTFFSKIDCKTIFNKLVRENPSLAANFSSLVAFISQEHLIDLFKNYISDYLSSQNIEEIMDFIKTHDKLLKTIPSGKLLHMIFSLISSKITGSKGAVYLSEFIHNSLLKSELPEYLIELYMLCEQKDVFEKSHTAMCLERLLLNKNIDIESQVCIKIKESAGPDSMDRTSSVLKVAKENWIDCKDMNVIIVTNKIMGFLNFFTNFKQEYVPKKLPVELSQRLEDFTSYYTQKFPKKILKWQYLNSIFYLQYKNSTICCNFVQCLILLMFNESLEVDIAKIL